MCASDSALIIDAGNTRIKWTLFDGDEIVDKWVGNEPIKERIGAPQHIVLASVRSNEHDIDLVARLRHLFPDQCLHRIQSERHACGVSNTYAEPMRLGVDRWLGAIAAYRLYGGPTVIVDAGTAIKMDFVSAEGKHLGGYIVPGLELMASSLVSKTARIRYDSSEVTATDGVPNSTAGAVSTGCFEMALGFVQRQYNKHQKAQWLATGGASQALMAPLDIEYVLDEHLVAKGAKYVLDARLKDEK